MYMKFINKTKEIVKEKKFKYICFFWIIISIQFVMGSNLQGRGHLPDNIKDFSIDILKIVILGIIFVLLHYYTLELIKSIKIKITDNKNKKESKTNKEEKTDKIIEKLKCQKIYLELKKNKWYICFIIIILCWLPTLLAFYPALVNYDGGYQIRDYFFEGDLAHHPIIITKLYTFFYELGLSYATPNIGMFLFAICQMSFMAAIFTYTIKFLEHNTNNKVLTIICLIFYGLFPYNQLFSIMTTKDVIFAGLFLLFVIYLYKILKEKFKLYEIIIIIFIGILMLLSRNNIKYTLEVAAPFLVLIFIKNKYNIIKIVSVFLIVIFAYQGINDLMYKIEKEKASETSKIWYDDGSLRMSTFTQAIARVARDKDNELTEEEKEKISYYFYNYKALAKTYKTNIADNTIKFTNNENVNKNKKQFFELFIELGKKYPITYIESFLDTTRGYWYIGDTSFSIIHHEQKPDTMGALELYTFAIGKKQYKVSENSKLPELKQFYRNAFAKNEYQKIPVLYMIFQPATYFYMIFAFLLYSIYKNEKNMLAVAIILFTFFASCYLANCSIIRYMYPVIASVPLVVQFLINGSKKKEI